MKIASHGTKPWENLFAFYNNENTNIADPALTINSFYD